MDKVLQYFINSDEIIWYNVICFVRMSIAYLVTCLIIPSFCLKSYLREKKVGFRIVFYQVAANIYINLWGFILAYTGSFSYFAVFLGIVIIPISIKVVIIRDSLKDGLHFMSSEAKAILIGTYGAKYLRKEFRNYLINQWKRFYINYIKKSKTEWAIIIITLLYAMLFWGYFRFFNPAYGHTDEETHLYWISCIIENNAFVKGLYPYGMHFLIAQLTTLFMIPADTGALVMSVVTMSIVFAMIYLVARNVFKSRYAALFGWCLLIISEMFVVRAYYRFEYIFPMEFSMIPVLMGICALIYTVKYKDRCSFILFTMSIAWSLYAHFYGTIVFGLICILFGVVYFIIIVKNKTLKKYLVSGVIGILLGIIPFCVGLLCGYEFEKSINWALGVFTADEQLINSGIENINNVELEEQETISHWMDIIDELEGNAFQSVEIVEIALVLWAIVLIYGLLGSIFSKKHRKHCMMYLLCSFIWFVLAAMSIASLLGIPCLLHENRAAGFLFIFSFIIFAIPFQICSDFLKCCIRGKKSIIIEYMMIIIGIVGCYYVVSEGYVKENLYSEAIVSDADGKLFLQLVENEKPYTWTVITTTNMLSMIKGEGYHMEILDVLEKSEKGEEIRIPTPKVYAVIEKQCTVYREAFIEVPEDNDDGIYENNISMENALDNSTDIFEAYGQAPDRAYYFNRPTIMSRLYYWALKLDETYPNEVSVYYEDDSTIIYLIEQDPYFLLNLSVDYMTGLEEYTNEN